MANKSNRRKKLSVNWKRRQRRFQKRKELSLMQGKALADNNITADPKDNNCRALCTIDPVVASPSTHPNKDIQTRTNVESQHPHSHPTSDRTNGNDQTEERINDESSVGCASEEPIPDDIETNTDLSSEKNVPDKSCDPALGRVQTDCENINDNRPIRVDGSSNDSQNQRPASSGGVRSPQLISGTSISIDLGSTTRVSVSMVSEADENLLSH